MAGGKRDLFINETIGREAQARAARLAGSRDADMVLKKLLACDKEGMKAVQEARRFAKTARAKRIADGHEKRKEGDVGECGSEEECESDEPSSDKPTKNAYSAQVIKRLGFDPTLKSSRGRRADDDPTNIYSKVSFHIVITSWKFKLTSRIDSFFFIFFSCQLKELASCREPDKISLGPRPGGRVRSVVSAPKKTGRGDPGSFGNDITLPDSDEEDDLGLAASEAFHGTFEGHTTGMVDLDESSDDEIIVEPPGAS